VSTVTDGPLAGSHVHAEGAGDSSASVPKTSRRTNGAARRRDDQVEGRYGPGRARRSQSTRTGVCQAGDRVRGTRIRHCPGPEPASYRGTGRRRARSPHPVRRRNPCAHRQARPPAAGRVHGDAGRPGARSRSAGRLPIRAAPRSAGPRTFDGLPLERCAAARSITPSPGTRCAPTTHATVETGDPASPTPAPFPYP